MKDIICIGSATRDNFLELDFNTINWPKTPLKKAIVLPFGEKLEVKKIFSTIGGNSANASVTFSRQGFKTACFAKVGNDLSGKELRTRLEKEKVDPILAISKNEPTAYSVLLLKNGERTILGYHGASNTFVKNDIKWNSLRAKWWYLSLAGDSIKLFKPLMAFARKNKIKVAFNPSGYHLKHGRKQILSSLKDLAFLVLNAGEAAALTGISFNRERQVFQKLDKLTPGIVAVTDGPRGVTVSDGKYIYKAGIFKEKKLADRTGAGDAFGSGFVAGLMRKNDIKYAIRLATANATAVVEKIGATEGILIKNDFNAPRFKNFKIRVKKL
ncbi:MAG: carbohydrate kinase family protein [Candidatus Pacebacteria bacterium]|nr:carbohydrate kinase family protein [Candidatus Paceibacterota bacterium]